MSQIDHLRLSCALITDNNNRLLTVRKKGSIYYMMAGGKISKGETPQQTLHRELLEELDLNVNENNMTYIGTHTTKAVNEHNTLVSAEVFHLEINTEHLQAHAEIEEVRWLETTTYSDFPLAHLLKEFSIPFWLKRDHIKKGG